jgi:hypothetical protein
VVDLQSCPSLSVMTAVQQGVGVALGAGAWVGDAFGGGVGFLGWWGTVGVEVREDVPPDLVQRHRVERVGMAGLCELHHALIVDQVFSFITMNCGSAPALTPEPQRAASSPTTTTGARGLSGLRCLAARVPVANQDQRLHLIQWVAWRSVGRGGWLQPRERRHRTLHKVHLHVPDEVAARPDVVRRGTAC